MFYSFDTPAGLLFSPAGDFLEQISNNTKLSRYGKMDEQRQPIAVYPNGMTRDEYEKRLKVHAKQIAATLIRLFPELSQGETAKKAA